MNLKKAISNLSKLEKGLWLVSMLSIIISFLIAGNYDIATVIASLIGVTALIFVAKGNAIGQFLIILFAVIYAFISWKCRYYGEMITYLGMTAPIALCSMIAWMKNPYSEQEVKVSHVTVPKWIVLIVLTGMVTWGFYYVLKYFDTPNLIVSTISVTTSFFAASLTFLRSPYYALFYAGNDIVLIVLWVLAARKESSYLPMVICFVIFLVNDIYGFWSWQAMQKRQLKKENKIECL